MPKLAAAERLNSLTCSDGSSTGRSAVPLQDAGPPAGEVHWEPVIPNAIPGIWHRIEPYIVKSAQWSDVTAKLESIQDIYDALIADQYGLWICTIDGHLKAALVVNIAVHPRCTVLDICYGAGESLDQWLKPFYDVIVDRVRSMGGRFIRVEGRPGWAKKLKTLGFRKVSEVFVVEI